MKNSSGATISSSGQADGLVVSQDGFVRLSLSDFMALPLTHFLSGLDDDPARHVVEGGVRASISGYTEWLSTSLPAVSIGWDWYLKLDVAVPGYIRDGWPRSNVMLVDAHSGIDLGIEATSIGISVWIDQSGWEESTARYIGQRYS